MEINGQKQNTEIKEAVALIEVDPNEGSKRRGYPQEREDGIMKKKKIPNFPVFIGIPLNIILP